MQTMKIIEALKNNDLGSIKLTKGPLTNENVLKIINAIYGNQSLKNLTIRNHCINYLWVKTLMSSLKVHPAIEYLELCSSKIRDKGANIISQASMNHPMLKKMCLSDNGITKRGAIALGSLLKNNQVLESLLLWRNPLGDEGACCLLEGLLNNTSLLELSLKQTELSDLSGRFIHDLLVENNKIERLYLGDNHIGSEGCQLIAEGLAQNTALKQLCLGGNPIGDEGLGALAHALKSNRTLEGLYLVGHHGFSDQGMIGLLSVLQKNTNIKKIWISSNNITCQSIFALSDLLKISNSLEKISISSPCHSCKKDLAVALKNNIVFQDFRGVTKGPFMEYINRNQLQRTYVEFHQFRHRIRNRRLLDNQIFIANTTTDSEQEHKKRKKRKKQTKYYPTQSLSAHGCGHMDSLFYLSAIESIRQGYLQVENFEPIDQLADYIPPCIPRQLRQIKHNNW